VPDHQAALAQAFADLEGGHLGVPSGNLADATSELDS
jgi:hypothetical protein